MAVVKETPTHLTVQFRSSFFTRTGLKGCLAIGAIFAFGFMAWTVLIPRDRGMAFLYGGGLMFSGIILFLVWGSFRVHPETCTFDLEHEQVILHLRSLPKPGSITHPLRIIRDVKAVPANEGYFGYLRYLEWVYEEAGQRYPVALRWAILGEAVPHMKGEYHVCLELMNGYSPYITAEMSSHREQQEALANRIRHFLVKDAPENVQDQS